MRLTILICCLLLSAQTSFATKSLTPFPALLKIKDLSVQHAQHPDNDAPTVAAFWHRNTSGSQLSYTAVLPETTQRPTLFTRFFQQLQPVHENHILETTRHLYPTHFFL